MGWTSEGRRRCAEQVGLLSWAVCRQLPAGHLLGQKKGYCWHIQHCLCDLGKETPCSYVVVEECLPPLGWEHLCRTNFLNVMQHSWGLRDMRTEKQRCKSKVCKEPQPSSWAPDKDSWPCCRGSVSSRYTLGCYCSEIPEQGESIGDYLEKVRVRGWVMPSNEGGVGTCVTVDRRKPWGGEGQRHPFRYCIRYHWVTNSKC